jgi:hypothetical protein
LSIVTARKAENLGLDLVVKDEEAIVSIFSVKYRSTSSANRGRRDKGHWRQDCEIKNGKAVTDGSCL